MSDSTLRIRVVRSESAALSDFRIGRIHPMSVLDALLAIQRDLDDSLGFRFSCRVAMCGTCTLRVNGESVLACQRMISDKDRELTIAPVAGMPVVRDLVVDTEPFWEQWRRITPYPVMDDTLAEPARISPDSEERQAIDSHQDCIQCGACYASCGIAGADGDFIGPAAATRALVLINDSRDRLGRERLDLLAEPGGISRCRFMYACTASCPKGLDPAKAFRDARSGRLKDR